MIEWRPGMTLDDLERQVILASIAHHDHNRTAAAKALGVSTRTIHNKLNRYGVKLPLPKNQGKKI